MVTFFPDHRDWEVQIHRLVAEAAHGGADVYEIDRTARRIPPGDHGAWQREWCRLAQEVEGLAREAEKQQHTVTAREAYFRASNYYRNSDFFLPGDDPRKRELYLDVQRCFTAGVRHHAPRVDIVEIPADGMTYAGYFCHPQNPRSRRVPGVILLGGADSLAEELFFFGGTEIVKRGLALLLVDTPGRGSSLRLKQLRAQADYERPVGRVLDYLESRPEVDRQRIGLVGSSMGGYYAPRAACFDKRIKALAVNSGCLDLVEDIFDFYPAIQRQLAWVIGAKDVTEARQRYAAFSLKGIAGQITCPVFVSHGADDFIMRPAGAARLFEAIGSKDKQLKIWRTEEGGAMHCSYDGWSALFPLLFDWLADRLG